MAVRIQRKRMKGWKMPPNCVYVGRPTKFGNDYEIVKAFDEWDEEYTWHVVTPEGMQCSDDYADKRDAAEVAVYAYRGAVEIWLLYEPDALEPLRGKDLACWCPLDQVCHADELLRLCAELDTD